MPADGARHVPRIAGVRHGPKECWIPGIHIPQVGRYEDYEALIVSPERSMDSSGLEQVEVGVLVLGDARTSKPMIGAGALAVPRSLVCTLPFAQ